MNYKLWNTCNDLDTIASNHAATLDAFGYIMEGMDKSAIEASRSGQEAAATFLSQYTNYSRMLFMLMDVMQDQEKQYQRLIEQAFNLVKEAVE